MFSNFSHGFNIIDVRTKKCVVIVLYCEEEIEPGQVIWAGESGQDSSVKSSIVGDVCACMSIVYLFRTCVLQPPRILNYSVPIRFFGQGRVVKCQSSILMICIGILW